MNNKQRKLLKKVRENGHISINLAANWAHVEQRTWRSWEAGDDKDTARSPSPAALWSFFVRSGLEVRDLKGKAEHSPRGLAFSISSYKGGVGKTPISLNVAASLIEQGFRVAIVTDDFVYRCACEDKEQPKPGSLVSKIDFYDELDLITFPSAVKQQREMREQLASLLPHEEAIFRAHHANALEALERKQRATEKLKELIARYDYVLIDMNGATELIRRFSSLVAIIVDTNCLMSVRSAKKFASALRQIKCRETTPSYFGLLTRCDVGGVSRELEEFIGDHMNLDEAQCQRLNEARHTVCQARERVLEQIEALDLPLLKTELTSAYSIALDMYELNSDDPQECSYFDSLLDFAPRSHAAREIRRLTDELINWRL
jgi:chromosome partitioning protein